MKRLTQSTALWAKTQTGNSFIIMHQRLVVVTSYLGQAERTGQLHSCSSLGQSKDLMENHVLIDVERHILCIQSSVEPHSVYFSTFRERGTPGRSSSWVFWSSRTCLSVGWGKDYNERLDKEDNPCRLRLRVQITDSFGMKPTRHRPIYCITWCWNISWFVLNDWT